MYCPWTCLGWKAWLGIFKGANVFSLLRHINLRKEKQSSRKGKWKVGSNIEIFFHCLTCDCSCVALSVMANKYWFR